MLQNQVAPGTDKKIILLNHWATIEYLNLQLEDILHDTDNITYLNEHVVELMATWIYENNSSLSTWNYIGFRECLISAMRQSRHSEFINELYENLLYDHEYRILSKPTVNGVIMDGCDSTTSSAFICNNKGRFYMPTPASFYDTGSASLCGGTMKYMRNGQPYKNIKGSTLNQDGKSLVPLFHNRDLLQYTEHPSIALSCTHLINFYCKKFPRNQNLQFRDFVILGTLPLPTGETQTVVLAYRGTQKITVYRNNIEEHYITCPYRINNNIVIKHCQNVLQKSLVILHDNLKSIATQDSIIKVNDSPDVIQQKTRAKMDKLVVYSELMAKHWGDLGMAVETVAENNIYLLSIDKILLKMAILFRTAIITNNTIYDVPNGELHGIKSHINVILEYNTASIFNRSEYDTYTMTTNQVDNFLNRK